jgi:phosphoribosyl 1,2-cyclic phosphate phosphodiesterase
MPCCHAIRPTDHIAGLDDVRAFNFFQQRAMPIYANELTMEALMREFGYALHKSGITAYPTCRCILLP